MGWDPREDAWLSGFTDGEGCFLIGTVQRGRILAPRFYLGLRADDMAVLEELQRALGGRLHLRPARGADAPQCAWLVSSKRELAGLVEYFDRFPLRAKKAADFALWREAVSVYCAASGADPRLAALKEALTLGRTYGAPGMDEPDSDDPFGVQLGLGIED
jgi:hypothetical protein